MRAASRSTPNRWFRSCSAGSRSRRPPPRRYCRRRNRTRRSNCSPTATEAMKHPDSDRRYLRDGVQRIAARARAGRAGRFPRHRRSAKWCRSIPGSTWPRGRSRCRSKSNCSPSAWFRARCRARKTGRIAHDPKANINMLVARGLRAQLRTGNLLTGQLYIALDFFPDAPKAKVDWNARPARASDHTGQPGRSEGIDHQRREEARQDGLRGDRHRPAADAEEHHQDDEGARCHHRRAYAGGESGDCGGAQRPGLRRPRARGRLADAAGRARDDVRDFARGAGVPRARRLSRAPSRGPDQRQEADDKTDAGKQEESKKEEKK